MLKKVSVPELHGLLFIVVISVTVFKRWCEYLRNINNTRNFPGLKLYSSVVISARATA